MSIEDVKQLNDSDLADKLAEAMGWKLDDHPAISGTGQWMAEYDYGVFYKQDETYQERLSWEPCDDWEQAHEVQAKAIEVDACMYVSYLSILKSVDIYHIDWSQHRIDGKYIKDHEVADLLTATPRQISEAAYLTLNS